VWQLEKILDEGDEGQGGHLDGTGAQGARPSTAPGHKNVAAGGGRGRAGGGEEGSEGREGRRRSRSTRSPGAMRRPGGPPRGVPPPGSAPLQRPLAAPGPSQGAQLRRLGVPGTPRREAATKRGADVLTLENERDQDREGVPEDGGLESDPVFRGTLPGAERDSLGEHGQAGSPDTDARGRAHQPAPPPTPPAPLAPPPAAP